MGAPVLHLGWLHSARRMGKSAALSGSKLSALFRRLHSHPQLEPPCGVARQNVTCNQPKVKQVEKTLACRKQTSSLTTKYKGRLPTTPRRSLQCPVSDPNPWEAPKAKPPKRGEARSTRIDKHPPRSATNIRLANTIDATRKTYPLSMRRLLVFPAVARRANQTGSF